MARTPSRFECDRCKNPLDSGAPFPTLEYPFSEEDVRELVESIAGSFPQAHQFLGFVPIRATHQFHFCKECVDRFLPMADAMKALAVSLQRDEWQARRRRYEQMQLKASDGPTEAIN